MVFASCWVCTDRGHHRGPRTADSGLHEDLEDHRCPGWLLFSSAIFCKLTRSDCHWLALTEVWFLKGTRWGISFSNTRNDVSRREPMVFDRWLRGSGGVWVWPNQSDDEPARDASSVKKCCGCGQFTKLLLGSGGSGLPVFGGGAGSEDWGARIWNVRRGTDDGFVRDAFCAQGADRRGNRRAAQTFTGGLEGKTAYRSSSATGIAVFSVCRSGSIVRRMGGSPRKTFAG